MKTDNTLSPVTALLAVATLLFPLLAIWQIPLADGNVVLAIEDLQSLWLLFGAAFTWVWMKPKTLAPQKKQFWLWSIVWWVVLFGRGISWGRDFFPEVPKIYFRTISVILIGTLVLMLLLPELRREIAVKMKSATLPTWTVILMVVSFLISDTIEHHRLLAPLFIRDPNYQDLLEEMYEIPFMLCLFIVAFSLMRSDKQIQKAQRLVPLEN